jgi:hypothetical protein
MASPDSMARLSRGVEMQLFLQLQNAGYTPEEIVKLKDMKEVLQQMRDTMLACPEFRLIHDRWAPLEDVVVQVKSWPGINPDLVDAAVKEAETNGTIAGYEAESAEKPKLGLVIDVARESLPATLQYSRDRVKETWGKKSRSGRLRTPAASTTRALLSSRVRNPSSPIASKSMLWTSVRTMTL